MIAFKLIAFKFRGAALAILIVTAVVTTASAQTSDNADGHRKDAPELHFAPRSGQMLEAAARAAIRESLKTRPEADELIPEMAILYRELALDDVLIKTRRVDLQFKIEQSLIDLGNFVMDDFIREERKREKAARAAAARGDDSLADRLGGKDSGEGGAARNRAQDLIDLITSTIAPESWDINGGLGSIRYFSLTPALVVRQTGNVDLTRLLRGLR